MAKLSLLERAAFHWRALALKYHGDWLVRSEAVVKLARSHDPRAVHLLVEALRDDDARVRESALNWLHLSFGKSGLIPAARILVESYDTDLRRQAAGLLSSCEQDVDVEEFRRRLETKEEEERRRLEEKEEVERKQRDQWEIEHPNEPKFPPVTFRYGCPSCANGCGGTIDVGEGLFPYYEEPAPYPFNYPLTRVKDFFLVYCPGCDQTWKVWRTGVYRYTWVRFTPEPTNPGYTDWAVRFEYVSQCKCGELSLYTMAGGA